MKLNKNDIHTVEIDGYTTEGLGVCKINGQVIFVAKAVSGDILEIKIVKVLKNIAYAIIVKIIEPSPNRIEPKCNVSSTCGGCSLWHMTYEEELKFKLDKVNSALLKLGKTEFKVAEIGGSNLIERYRNKAQFPVAKVDGECITGFYRNNSHDIVKTKDCLIQTQTSNEIVNFICEFINDNNISVYDESAGNGLIRNIYIRTGFKSDEILVCIVSTDFNIKNIDVLAKKLKDRFSNIASLVINKNSKKTNAVLGNEYKTIFGEGTLTDVLCENKFAISPESFYQVNHNNAENLYKKAIEFCEFQGNETILDMYCGAGTITLYAAKFVKEIIGVEIVEKAIINAKKNASINKISNAKFICADAKKASENFTKKNMKFDTIIVDPPRKGLDEVTKSSIVTLNPKKICYVSCDPATLARDVKYFIENGYKIEKGYAFDLFPRTWHVETCVLLSHKNS